MAIPAAIVIVPVGILFILSGLIVNLIQAVFFILVRPLSKNMYRRINKVVAELLWMELIWLFDWWAGIKVDLYVDLDTFQLMGKEHALVICNHRSDIDWLVGWVLAQVYMCHVSKNILQSACVTFRSGCLGTALAVMKKSLKFLPIIGWSMWFSDYVFLERSWAKDERTLKSGFQCLENFPRPFWLAIFVEGTRFTPAKLLAAQEYAATAGLPVPRNVLIPRTKGFVTAVSHMRSFVPALYDITVAVPKNQPSPTMLRMFRGQSSVVSVHIKRRSMHELPERESDISKWCKDLFVDKDAFLDNFLATDTFGDQEYQDIGRPKKPLFVTIIWSCLLIVGAIELFRWSSLFTVWEGIAFAATLLVIVTIVMQILILFTQSEHSTHPKATPQSSLKEKLLVK